MIKFFGLLSKKKKIALSKVAPIYVSELDNVIDQGFVEIKDFINNNNNLEDSPNLSHEDIVWFRNIIFLGNIYDLTMYFEDVEASRIRDLVLDEIYMGLEDNEKNLAIERFLDYENYFSDLIRDNGTSINAMAYAIFEKYNINNFQGDLFKRKNKPNPIFFNELKNLLKHFMWNWEDYLQKNKVNF